MLIKEMNKPKAQWHLCKEIFQDLHQDYVNPRIFKKSKSTFCLRMTALHSNHVRGYILNILFIQHLNIIVAKVFMKSLMKPLENP